MILHLARKIEVIVGLNLLKKLRKKRTPSTPTNKLYGLRIRKKTCGVRLCGVQTPLFLHVCSGPCKNDRVLFLPPLSLWHNRGHQTTPLSKQSVTRLKITEKNFTKNNQKQTKGDFHCLEVHIRIMTIKKGSQHSLSQLNNSILLFLPSKGLMRKT